MAKMKWMPRTEVVRNRMQLLRLANGWSRAELGRRAAVNPTDIGRIESGRMVPFRGQLERTAAALGPEAGEAETLLDEVECCVDLKTDADVVPSANNEHTAEQRHDG